MAAYSGHQTDFRRTTKADRLELGRRFPVEGPVEGPDHGYDPLLPDFARLAVLREDMLKLYGYAFRMEAQPETLPDYPSLDERIERAARKAADYLKLLECVQTQARQSMMSKFDASLSGELIGAVESFETASEEYLVVMFITGKPEKPDFAKLGKARLRYFLWKNPVPIAPCTEPVITIHADPDLAPETAEALGNMVSAAVSAVQTGKIGKRRLTPTEEVARKISQSPRHWDEMYEKQWRWHEQTAEAQKSAPPFRLSDRAHAVTTDGKTFICPAPDFAPEADREDLLEQAAMRRAPVAADKIDEMLEAVKFAVEHWDDREARVLPDGYQIYQAPGRPIGSDAPERPHAGYIIWKHINLANRVVVGMNDLITGEMEFVARREEFRDYMIKVKAALEAAEITA